MTQPQDRLTSADVVNILDLDLSTACAMMRRIEKESGFHNVDDFEADDFETDVQRAAEIATKMLLVITEFAEAFEVIRTGVFDSVALREEFADIYIRLFSLTAALGFHQPMLTGIDTQGELRMAKLDITTGDISDFIVKKAAYNTTRPRKHGKLL